MRAAFSSASVMILAVSLAGCATYEGGGGRSSGVEVTRFHLGQPIARGPIAIEAFEPADANGLEFRAYADAVARHLSAQGWTVVETLGQSEQVALVDVRQGSRETFTSPSPFSVSIGGYGGGWNSGGAVGATFGGGGGRGVELVGTMLEVRIKRRSDGTVFWEGRALSEARAGTEQAQRTMAVERLAEALFRDFPGESGRTIRAR
jgi:Domain of unknown function (DUF4136)